MEKFYTTTQSNVSQDRLKMDNIKEKTVSEDEYDFDIDSPLPYYAVSLAYGVFFLGVYFKNQMIGVSFLFGLVPFADSYTSLDLKNPSRNKEKELRNRNLEFKVPLYCAVFFDLFTFIYGVHHLVECDNGFFYKLCCLVVLANLQAVSINYAHEMLHKCSLIDNIISAILLTKNYYLHFFVEHTYGHHKNVGTPLDPASAVQGQTLYDFIPKSIIGSFWSCMKIEQEMVKESKRSVFTNRIYLSIVLYVTLTFLYLYNWGFLKAISAILIGFGGSVILELINYIEHYGLRRKLLPNGEYENVSIKHSWNTPHRISNYFLFKLQRHSDHHANALKPYQTLCTYEDSPIFPNGYAFCILLSTVPSSWFYIIDPLVTEYNTTGKISTDSRIKAEQKCLNFLNKCAYLLLVMFLVQVGINLI